MGRRAIAILTSAAALAAAPAAHAYVFTVAGGGLASSGLGDGAPASSVPLSSPRAVEEEASGSYLIAETGSDRVRRVASDGFISTVIAPAGRPTGLAALPDGAFLMSLADGRIRRVALDGSVTTVAAGFSRPADVAALQDGGFLVADTFNNRIRRVFPDGHVETVAGSGATGRAGGAFGGDGGPATRARLNLPEGVAPTGDGGFLIADTGNWRVRKVGADGRITTIAGNGRHRVGRTHRRPALTTTIGPVHAVGVASFGTVFENFYFTTDKAYTAEMGTLRVVVPRATEAAGLAGGGALITSGNRVLFEALLNTPRLAVAISPQTIAPARSLTVRYLTTIAATLHVDVVRSGVTTATADGQAPGGPGDLPVAMTLQPESLYRIEMTATDRHGAVTTQRIGLVVAPLPLEVASWAAQAQVSTGTKVSGCRRITRVRVDCRTAGGGKRCSRMQAVTLRADGRLALRAYECPLTRSPRFTGPPAVVLPPLEPPQR